MLHRGITSRVLNFSRRPDTFFLPVLLVDTVFAPFVITQFSVIVINIKMNSFLLNIAAPIVGSLAVEEYVLKQYLPLLYAGTYLPRSYAGVILVNVIGSGLLVVTLGFKVPAARKSCQIQAESEGDKDAEARFSYPKMYAEGFSEPARVFNCVQRGHQQALETYPMFIAWSLIGGLMYPVSCAFGGLVWIYARLQV